MNIKIDYTNTSSKADAYAAVKSAVTPEMLAKWQVKAELIYTDDNITAKGSGFTLSVDFLDNYCDINIKLNLLLKPLKSKIAEGIEKQFKRVV